MRNSIALRKSVSWNALLLTIAASATALPAIAQEQPIPPEYYTLDPRGVDLVTGRFNYGTTEVVIGQPAAGGLSYGRTYVGAGEGWRDNGLGTINLVGAAYVVSVGPISERFTRSGTTFTPVSNNGSTLVLDGSATSYIFTASGGDVYRFTTAHRGATSPYRMDEAILTAVERANGEQRDYHYKSVTYCQLTGPSGNCLQYATLLRLQAISNNFGYQLKYDYDSNSFGEGVPSSPWLRLNRVTGFNMAIDYCASGVDTCPTFTRVWPSVTYPNATTATDQSGRSTVYSTTANRLSAVRVPGATSDVLSVTYDGAGLTAGVTDASGAWTYGYVNSGTTRTTTATGPLGQVLTAVSNQTIGRAISIARATSPTTSVTTSYSYDGQNRLQRVTQPEGDYAQVTYDARGNVTQTLFVPKAGSGLSNLTTSATFAATCSNPVSCNRPTTTTDARSAVTNYAWNGTHGGLESMTLPAPTSGAVRPQTRITYAPQHAWYKNSSGVIVQDPNAVTLPVQTSECATLATCAGTADEVRSTLVYGSAGVENNLLPTSTTTGAGDGLVSATTALTYNVQGDVRTVDGPLPGADDTTRYRYDEARQLRGVVGPDPDGAGPLLNRAQRITYNPDGTLQLLEVGTTVGQTDPSFATFNSLQQTATAHDAYQRTTESRFTAGGTTYSVSQVSYDAAGRPQCTAMRMNPSVFASLPAACTLSTVGIYGADRIIQFAYDAASRNTSVTSGVGTADSLTESTTYTQNGQVQTLVDGNGNRSTFEYDGFDRLTKLRYPTATNGSVSSLTDFELFGYDQNSNVVSYTTRNTQLFTTTYDALNRPIVATRPANVGSVAYTYDVLNRPLSAGIVRTPPLSPDPSVTMTWDALGRQLTETDSILGQNLMRYDPAGRRTRLTWPDGSYVTYTYDLTNAMTGILQSGTNPYVNYAYDNLGRRATLTRRNNVTTTYGYDPASRLTSLSHNLSGSANDQTYSYSHNPAGQIFSMATANPVYEYPVPAASSNAYPINGLNQTGVNGGPLPYDVKGNLLGDGVHAYTYDQANRLRSGTVGGVTASLTYDPLDRLSGMTGTQAGRFLYDGNEIAGVAPTGSTTLTNRIIRGPGPDEVAVVATSSTPVWNLQDHLGSTIGITNSSGALTNALSYDEYGNPGGTNTGRFQYTGQLWMPDLAAYHYKTRAYHATLGRFLQTDPVQYAAGANLYAYVDNDPINFVDPLGLLQDQSDKVDDVLVDAARPFPFDPGLANFLNQTGAGFTSGYRRAITGLENVTEDLGATVCRAVANAPDDATIQASLAFTAIAGWGLSDGVVVNAFRNETGGMTIRFQETGYDGFGFGMNVGASLGASWSSASGRTIVGAPDISDLAKSGPSLMPSLGAETDFLRSYLSGTFAVGVPGQFTRVQNTASRPLGYVNVCT